MPFKSKSQWRLCWLQRSRGQKGWDCEEWGKGQKYTKLPERITSRKSRKVKRSTKTSKRRKVKSRKIKVRSRSRR